jgi:hypothetical protein
MRPVQEKNQRKTGARTGRPVADPWGEDRDGRWHVAADETLEELVAALHPLRRHAAGPSWNPMTVKLLQMVRPGGTLLSMGVAVRPETGLHPAR